MVRIDEGWMILSADLVHEFLNNRDKLLCHKYADQAVAMWIYESMKRKKVAWFGDPRIYHHPPVATINQFKLRKELCHTFLSLHGSYPIEMRVFQMIVEKERRTLGSIYSIPPVTDFCPFQRVNFNLHFFEMKYYTDPLPCKDNPVWTSAGEVFLGRSLDVRKEIAERKNRTTKETIKSPKMSFFIAGPSTKSGKDINGK